MLVDHEPAGFFAFLPMPSGTVQNAWRCSRIVFLPEYQGLGLGYNVTKYMFSLFISAKKKMYIRTINPALVAAFKKDSDFKYNGFSKSSPEGGALAGRKIRESKAHSFQYIGQASQDDCSIVSMNREQILDNNMTFDFL